MSNKFAGIGKRILISTFYSIIALLLLGCKANKSSIDEYLTNNITPTPNMILDKQLV